MHSISCRCVFQFLKPAKESLQNFILKTSQLCGFIMMLFLLFLWQLLAVSILSIALGVREWISSLTILYWILFFWKIVSSKNSDIHLSSSQKQNKWSSLDASKWIIWSHPSLLPIIFSWSIKSFRCGWGIYDFFYFLPSLVASDGFKAKDDVY